MDTGVLTPKATAELSQDIMPVEDAAYEPTPEDWADYGLWAQDMELRFMEEYLPQPQDYEIAQPIEEPDA